MGLVRIQFAADMKPGLLTHLRKHMRGINELSDETLYARWVDDLVESMADHFVRNAGRFSRVQTSDTFVFIQSNWATDQRHTLGYTVRLQEWSDDLPYEDDDVAREVTRSPHWLRRVIVLVWQPVGLKE
jgi:hypothetical protein